MNSGGRANTGRASAIALRNALIVAQVSVCFILLVVAGLTIRSFIKLQQVDGGFDPENVVTANLPLNFTKFTQPAQVRDLQHRILDRVEQLPGVNAVAYISGLPLNNATPSPSSMQLEGKDADVSKALVDVTLVSPNAFKALGLPFLRGRDFARTDTMDATPVAIITQDTARKYWGSEDPVGRRISIDEGHTWLTVIGVVGDAQFFGLDKPSMDTVYLPVDQGGAVTNLVIRTPMDSFSMGQELTRAVHELDSEQPVSAITTLAQIKENSLAATRVTATLLGLFAGLALVLAATGLTGVISFLVSHRTREIGIRMALGAERSSVLIMILRQALRVVAIGLALGAIGSILATRMVRSMLFGITSTDWVTFIGVSCLFVLVSLGASYMPARRASLLDPIQSLRD